MKILSIIGHMEDQIFLLTSSHRLQFFSIIFFNMFYGCFMEAIFFFLDYKTYDSVRMITKQ